MSNFRELNRLVRGKPLASKIFQGGGTVKNDSSGSGSISLPEEISRNSLSRILENIDLEICSISEASTSKNNSNIENDANSNNSESGKKEYDAVIRNMTHKTTLLANKIVSTIRYIASPLRLYVKAKSNFIFDPQERYNFVNNIKICNKIKNDFISNWNEIDLVGLKILVKFSKYDSIVKTGSHPNQQILVNIISNNLISNINEWISKLFTEFKSDPDTEPWIDFCEKDLEKKIGRELVAYSNIFFEKPIQFSLHDRVDKIKVMPGDLLKEIYNLFANSGDPKGNEIAQNMNIWLNEQLGGCVSLLKKRHKKRLM